MHTNTQFIVIVKATTKSNHPNFNCSLADKQTDKQRVIIFGEVHFHVQEGHSNGCGLDIFIN